MGVYEYLRGSNQSFQNFRIFEEVAFAVIAPHGTANTAQPALNVEIAVFVIIERMTFDAALGDKLADISVRPLQYREKDLNVIFLTAIKTAYRWLAVAFGSCGTFTAADALHGSVENLILF